MKIPEGADWCEKCSEFFLPILGVRGCPFCTPAPRPQDVGRKRVKAKDPACEVCGHPVRIREKDGDSTYCVGGRYWHFDCWFKRVELRE